MPCDANEKRLLEAQTLIQKVLDHFPLQAPSDPKTDPGSDSESGQASSGQLSDDEPSCPRSSGPDSNAKNYPKDADFLRNLRRGPDFWGNHNIKSSEKPKHPSGPADNARGESFKAKKKNRGDDFASMMKRYCFDESGDESEGSRLGRRTSKTRE